MTYIENHWNHRYLRVPAKFTHWFIWKYCSMDWDGTFYMRFLSTEGSLASILAAKQNGGREPPFSDLLTKWGKRYTCDTRPIFNNKKDLCRPRNMGSFGMMPYHLCPSTREYLNWKLPFFLLSCFSKCEICLELLCCVKTALPIFLSSPSVCYAQYTV